MQKRKVEIIVTGSGEIPVYKTECSAGADLYSANEKDVRIFPGERILIPTGLKMAMPEDAEAQVRPRSGLSLNSGIVAILGTIDSDYRGEVGVIMMNVSKETVVIPPKYRVAQIVFNGAGGLFQADFKEVKNFTVPETGRGEHGFGSTGA